MSLTNQIQSYMQEPTKTKLADTLILLCQNSLWMPMTILPKSGIKKVPDELIKGDQSYIPLFTDRKEIKDAYYNEFFWVRVSLPDLVDQYDAFVIDPFTTNFVIEKDLIEVIRQSRKEG